MKKLMEYWIISGAVVEKRQSMMEPGRRSALPKRRGTKVKGRTSKAKIDANERDAVRRLAREINCNFGPGDLWLTLRFADDETAASEDDAEAALQKFLRAARKEWRRKTGEAMLYIIGPGRQDPRDGGEVRRHYHVVMPAMAYETVCRLWPQDQITYRRLDGRRDYTGVARYIVGNGRNSDGKKKWRCSKGLKKPVYTEPVEVKRGEKLAAPSRGIIRERAEAVDVESGIETSYLRYIDPKLVEKAKERERGRRCGG